MSTTLSMTPGRSLAVLAAAVLLAAGVARAQFAHSTGAADNAVPTANESSSSAGLPDVAAMSAEPAAGQYDRSGGYGRRGIWSHLAYEVGGGFNAPTPETSTYLTWGGNFTGGVGYRFDPHFSLMAEYQFIDSKLPAAVIAPTGANGGHAHIWSLTLAPVLDLAPKSTNDLYITGGGGFYRKVTSFTDPVLTEYCDYYYCEVGTTAQVVGHFSSNQGGWNIGMGYARRLGDRYSNSTMKLFAEARYLYVQTPAVTTSPNGLSQTSVAANTKIIPVTVGLRW
ncbi:MAG: outer membrane beta-barrel protein [Rhodoferax sp.]|nr:outer membrane beta-barrel protein [Rhodoferax sp.]